MSKLAMTAAIVLCAGFGVAVPQSAQAQDRFEANTQGYFGGYSTFGGYYDTFGGYGGQHAYGYRRYNQVYTPTTSLFALPLDEPVTNPDACATYRQRAKATGSSKAQARYLACRRGS